MKECRERRLRKIKQLIKKFSSWLAKVGEFFSLITLSECNLQDDDGGDYVPLHTDRRRRRRRWAKWMSSDVIPCYL